MDVFFFVKMLLKKYNKNIFSNNGSPLNWVSFMMISKFVKKT